MSSPQTPKYVGLPHTRALPAVPWAFTVLAWLRCPLVLFVILPISFILDIVTRCRNWYFHNFRRAPQLHLRRVEYVQQQVRRWSRTKPSERQPLCTSRNPAAGMNTRMPDFKSRCHRIDVSGLRDILEVDTTNLTIRLEPLVDMGYVSRILIPQGLALQCLPEMDDLTIGGLVNGYGVSTQSHLFGTMQDTVVSVELVLPDGNLAVATKDNEYRDLFRAVPWSHGTLGITVAVTVRLTRVKPYVRMRYIPCFSVSELHKLAKELVSAECPPDFFEATLFSPTTAVIQAGYYDDGKDSSLKVNHIGRFWKPWFCKHVESVLWLGREKSELIPLREYYHRHTKAIYWELEDMIPFANHPLYRYTLAWLGAPKVSLVKATQGTAVRRAILYKHVCQEFMVPLALLPQQHQLYSEKFQTYPLLLYIIRVYDYKEADVAAIGQGMIRAPHDEVKEPGKDFAFFSELGAYGVPMAVRRFSYWDALSNIREVEEWARDNGGYQCLCFDTLQSPEEFTEMFDHRLQWAVRRKYHKMDNAFPVVFAKIKPERAMGLAYQNE